MPQTKVVAATAPQSAVSVAMNEDRRTLLADPVAEAMRVATEAGTELSLRLLGGVAVRLHVDHVPRSLIREFEDIDFVTTSKAGGDVARLLEDLGYQGNERFNTLNGHRRLVFYDLENHRHVDVFVGEFSLCHKIPLEERLDLDSPTIPLADLLLTKLQVVEINHKDLGDIALLLLEHEVAEHDKEAVNGAYVAELLASDWGLWRTATGSLERLRSRLTELGLEAGQLQIVAERIERLLAQVEDQPKSMKWRARARVGERKRWYEEPEEIGHAAH